LARLRLSDDEVETMAGELSGILEHVDRIGRLDLEGVEPTSHVVALENVLRADEPRPSWPQEEILAPAPDPADGAFRVPSPQAEA
jgi:aspartyl-tRNA(Asn)/glutamyl-tRNA(Gln) amidotransferase subunit C